MNISKKDLYILIFLLGFLSIFAQTFLFRELTTTLRANELVLSLLLFCWFLATGLGASFGIPFIGLYEKFFLYIFLIALNPFLLKIYTMLFQETAGAFIELHKLFFITILLLFPFCYLSGSIFLDVSRIFVRIGGRPDKLYAADAVGGFLGGGLTYFVIARLESALILAFISLFGIVALSIIGGKRKFFFFIIPAIGVLVLSRQINNKLDTILWQGFSVKSIESVYGKSFILEREGERYFYHLGTLVSSSGDSVTKEILVHPIFSQVETVNNVFVAGGLALGIVEEIEKYSPSFVEIVEMDPGIIRILNEFGRDVKFKSERISLEIGDPRYILKHSKRVYDIIAIYFNNPTSGVMNRFYTKEFFFEACKHLNPNGVFALYLTIGENYPSRLEQVMVNSIFRGISEIFNNHRFLFAGSTLILVASPKRKLDSAIDAVQKKSSAGLLSPKFLYGANLEYTFEPMRENRVVSLIENVGFSFTNTDIRPIAYMFSILNWTKNLNLYPEQFVKYAWLFYIILWLNIFIAKIISNFILKRKLFFIENLVFVLVWGIGVMLVQFSAFYFYQANSGYLYWAIGILTGGLMLGLTIGSRLSGFCTNFSLWIRLVGLVGILWAAIFLFFTYKTNVLAGLKGLALLIIFLPFMITHGIIAGFLYPQNVCWMKQRGLFGERRMGVASTFDLLGASIGALLAGVFLIPALGIRTNILLWIITLSLSIPWRL